MGIERTLAEAVTFFDETIDVLKLAFRSIEKSAPKPVLKRIGDTHVFRFENPSLHLAIYLKLIRMISLLGALRELLVSGYVQEQGILQRALDETLDDIMFLAFADQDGVQPVHKEFLNAFWAEEFDAADGKVAHFRRPSIPRKKISALNSKKSGADPSTAQYFDRVIQGAFSGYVHGAAPHILDLYDPVREEMALSGATFLPVKESYTQNAINYPYRALIAAIVVTRRLGAAAEVSALEKQLQIADKFVGVPRGNEAKDLLERTRRKHTR